MIKSSGKILHAWNFKMIWKSSQKLPYHQICVSEVQLDTFLPILCFTFLTLNREIKIVHISVFIANEATWTPPRPSQSNPPTLGCTDDWIAQVSRYTLQRLLPPCPFCSSCRCLISSTSKGRGKGRTHATIILTSLPPTLF